MLLYFKGEREVQVLLYFKGELEVQVLLYFKGERVEDVHTAISLRRYIYVYTQNKLSLLTFLFLLPVVPHKAVAEVSKIGNL